MQKAKTNLKLLKNKNIIQTLTAEGRQKMRKEFTPIPYKLFPIEKEIIDGTNCLAFALGIYKPCEEGEDYNLQNNIPIDKAFLNKVSKLGFDTKKFRKIRTEDEAKVKGSIIRIYQFSKVTLSDGTNTDDFHVIRREINGLWVHKPGFGYCPRVVSITDWMTIWSIYGNGFVSFAIEE